MENHEAPGPLSRQSLAAVAMVEAEGRGLYGLVKNAGVALVGPLIAMPDDRSQYQDPDDVANAALHFMSSDTPKRR